MPPIDEYRKDASFAASDMQKLLRGDQWAVYERVWETMRASPDVFTSPLVSRPSLEQYRHETWRQVRAVYEAGLVREEDAPEHVQAVSLALAMFDFSLCPKVILHATLFVSCLRNLGSARHARFISPCFRLRIIGCFALTELSHGSNVRGIQTTATYCRETDAFTLHTPCREATKWWIGLAGKTANHAVVFARLVLADGSDMGPHPFLVQIRSLETHLPMPGVVVGDLGEKIGQNGLDNGFIAFNNVHLPLENLLNRVGDVLPGGKYVSEFKTDGARFAATLAPLSGGRVGIVSLCNTSLQLATVIATRYSAVRRQFDRPGDDAELPVIEYPLQRVRLFPYIAAAYAVHFFARWLGVQHATSAPEAQAEMHALSCAAKPLAGWLARDGIQTAREATGGHGYSACSRLGLLRADHDPNLTYEGDNNVLMQQTAKFLVGAVRAKLAKGRPIRSPLGTLDFLDALVGSAGQPQPEAEVDDPRWFLAALRSRVAARLQASMDRLGECVAEADGDLFDAWNAAQPFFLQDAARAYIELVVAERFHEAVERDVADPALRNVLRRLSAIYALHCLAGDGEHGLGASARRGLVALTTALLPDAVSLVDAYAPPDDVLYSTIGRSDGQAYDHLYTAVTAAPGCFERVSWWTDICAHRSRL